MSVTLRLAKAADIPAIAKLMNLAYRGTGSGASWNTESRYLEGDRTSEAALREELASKPESTLLVAENGTSAEEPEALLLGCVWLEAVTAKTWYLGSLAVNPAQQKSGLGRTVLEMAEQWARDRGADRIEMHVVNVRDTLIAWYERRGYRVTGETHPFPYGDNRFGTPLRNDLSFVVLEKNF